MRTYSMKASEQGRLKFKSKVLLFFSWSENFETEPLLLFNVPPSHAPTKIFTSPFHGPQEKIQWETKLKLTSTTKRKTQPFSVLS